jgi:hypothetical protein
MEFGDAFDVLADSGTYVEMVGAGTAGYMGSHVVNNLAERYAPMDVPDEASGLAVIAGAEVAGVPYKRPMQFGAGVYTGEKAAERVGIRETIVSVGAN